MLQGLDTDIRLDFTLAESDQEKYASLLNQSRSGWLRLDILSLDGFTQSDELVYTLCDESGRILPSAFAQTLMESVAVVSEQPYREQLETQISGTKSSVSQLFLIEWSVKNSIIGKDSDS